MPKPLTIKNYIQEWRLFTRRTIFLASICGLLAFFLLARLIYLQIYQHNLYTTLSNQNQLNLIPVEPRRGLIYDRHGVLLAENKPVFSLNITPELAPNLKQTINDLEKIIKINPEDIKTFYKDVRTHHRYASVPLKINLNEEEIARFMVRQYEFPGVSIKALLIRHYPVGDAVVPVLGYMGRINTEELNQVDSTNYSASQYIGKLGIEKYYEDKLHGTIGNQQVETDASGRVVRIIKNISSVSGENLYLTIDARLQIAAKNILGTNPGSIVAIDPNNGQVLALVSNPSYDPNLFVNGISKVDYDNLRKSPIRPLLNRAIRGQYPMASTIKPFLALGGLESGIIDKNYSIHDPGVYTLPNSSHVFHDHTVGGHGIVNVVRAIIVSCDTFFYTLSNKLGVTRIDSILTSFGFGRLTNIDLQDESAGLVPSPEWKKRRFHVPWYAGDTVSFSIGQGYMLTTPLQSAQAVAAIAAKGARYKPYLLLKAQNPDGTVDFTKPMRVPSLNIKPANWDTVLQGMLGVVNSPEGTATRIMKGTTYTLAGKTGTAQVFHNPKIGKTNQMTLPLELRNHTWFVAFAPVEKPRIAIAVILEHNSTAPKIAREFLDYYFQLDKGKVDKIESR